jgi:hypothetical protein
MDANGADDQGVEPGAFAYRGRRSDQRGVGEAEYVIASAQAGGDRWYMRITIFSACLLIVRLVHVCTRNTRRRLVVWVKDMA